jgi:hypothetical protein
MKSLIRSNAVALTLSLILPGLALAQQAADTAAPATAAPATEAAPANKEQVASLMGYRLTQRPVPDLKTARIYAGEWITAGYLTDVKVGKVKNVGGLFIADLVLKEQPKQVSNQLLIRKRDGFSILVYPGTPKQPPAEQMIGMAGLEGMSGMSGAKTIQAAPSAHGGIKVKSARHAKRIVDAWLLFNGLPDLYAGDTRDLGGVYITRIVDAKGKQKNQTAMRKSDGYIQMMHPVAAIGSKRS